ncbi:RNA exonuclease 1 homolog [Gastrophryne carolinensis]
MLKSTGYFRAVDCPFREACRRPHCHFRHRGRGLWSCETTEARNGVEYDPYTPDLPPIRNILEVGSKPCHDILELERVNKAIEEVKNEMEKEQRKYNKLLEYSSALEKTSTSSSVSSLEYDPGCSNISASEYNPTLLSFSVKPCKYTLDDLESNCSKSGSMEYIPTVVKKCSAKYVVDNSKPSTDMEYDPLSNYSARLLNKVKNEKANKRSRNVSHDEEYTPYVIKSCSQTFEMLPEATFSDSEDDCSSTAIVNERVFTSTKDKSTRKLKETAVQYNLDDVKVKKMCQSKDPPKQASHGDPKTEQTVSVTEPSVLHKPANKSKVSSKEQKKEKKSKSELPDVKNRKKSMKPDKKIKSGNKCPEKSEPQLASKALVVKEPQVTKKKNDSKHKKEITNSTVKELKLEVGDVNGEQHKEKKRKSKSLEKVKESTEVVLKPRTKQRTLSHVDLFGDESSEEETEVKKKTCNSSGDKNSKSTKRTKGSSSRSSVSSLDSSEVDYSVLEQELDSDPDPMEECLRVFNESQDVKTEDKGRKRKQPDEDDPDRADQNTMPLLPGQKKRISHVSQSNHADITSKPVVRPYRRPTPQEICYQRIQKAQKQATQLLSQKQVISLPTSSRMSTLALPGEKKRVAHVPCAQSSSSVQSQLPAEGRSPSLVKSISSSSLKTRTMAGMPSKTTSPTMLKRQAHVPSLESIALKRPVIPTEYGAKVPTTIRQRYLNFFIDECLKICHKQQEAFDKALEEEKAVYMRSNSRNIYLNVAVNTLKKLRSQSSTTKRASKEVASKKSVSHKSILDGKLAAKTSFSIHQSTYQEEELTDETLYKKLKNYILTLEQLKEHGYPFPHPNSTGKAMVFTKEEKKSLSSFCRVCCRCGVEYMVTQTGSCVRKEECIHHWGRLRKIRAPGGWETQYSCCSGGVGSPGCQVAKQHVHDGRKENLDGFVKTFEKLSNSNGSPGVFALDCEMCYTTKGLELARVTVINSQLKVVYDTFVQPDNKIVDYNTRFSGVTEEDLENTSITLRDVQAVLLSMFSCDTVLIGHSLESDLFALKIIHPTVIDTAIVFPHRLGLPYKRALRSLMADHLKRIIQDNVEGHDSSEDACSCMELMMWRIKEDAKVKR